MNIRFQLCFRMFHNIGNLTTHIVIHYLYFDKYQKLNNRFYSKEINNTHETDVNIHFNYTQSKDESKMYFCLS